MLYIWEVDIVRSCKWQNCHGSMISSANFTRLLNHVHKNGCRTKSIICQLLWTQCLSTVTVG